MLCSMLEYYWSSRYPETTACGTGSPNALLEVVDKGMWALKAVLCVTGIPYSLMNLVFENTSLRYPQLIAEDFELRSSRPEAPIISPLFLSPEVHLCIQTVVRCFYIAISLESLAIFAAWWACWACWCWRLAVFCDENLPLYCPFKWNVS